MYDHLNRAVERENLEKELIEIRKDVTKIDSASVESIIKGNKYEQKYKTRKVPVIANLGDNKLDSAIASEVLKYQQSKH